MDVHDPQGTDGYLELTQGAAKQFATGYKSRKEVLKAIDQYAWERFKTKAEESEVRRGKRKGVRVGAITWHLENMDNANADSPEFVDPLSGNELAKGGIQDDLDTDAWRASFGDLECPEEWQGTSRTYKCLFRITPDEKIFVDDRSTKTIVGVQVEYMHKTQVILHMHEQYKTTGGKGSRHRVPNPDRPGQDMWTNLIEYPAGYVSPITNAPWPGSVSQGSLMPLIVEAHKAGLMTADGGFPNIVATAAPRPSVAVMRAAAEELENEGVHLAALQQLGQEQLAAAVVDAPPPLTEDPIPQIDDWEARSRDRRIVRLGRLETVQLQSSIFVPVAQGIDALFTVDMYKVGSVLGQEEIGTITSDEFEWLGWIKDGGLLHRTDNLWKARGLNYRHFVRFRSPSRATGDKGLLQYPGERAVSLDALVLTHNSRHYAYARENDVRKLMPMRGLNEQFWRENWNRDITRRMLEIGTSQADPHQFDHFLENLIERPRFIDGMRSDAIQRAVSDAHKKRIEDTFPKTVNNITTTPDALLPADRMSIINALVTVVIEGTPSAPPTTFRGTQGWIELDYDPGYGVKFPGYTVYLRYIIKYRGRDNVAYEDPRFQGALQVSGMDNGTRMDATALGNENEALLGGIYDERFVRETQTPGFEDDEEAEEYARFRFAQYSNYWRTNGENGGPWLQTGRAAISGNGNGMIEARLLPPFPRSQDRETSLPHRSFWPVLWGYPQKLLLAHKRHGMYDDPERELFPGTPLPPDHGIDQARIDFPDSTLQSRRIATNAQAPHGMCFSMAGRWFHNIDDFKLLLHPEDATEAERVPGTLARGEALPTMRKVRVSARALSALFLQEQLRRPQQEPDTDGRYNPPPSAASWRSEECGPLLAALHRPIDFTTGTMHQDSPGLNNPNRLEPVSYADPWYSEDPWQLEVRMRTEAEDIPARSVYKSGMLLQLARRGEYEEKVRTYLDRLKREATAAGRMDGERRRPPREPLSSEQLLQPAPLPPPNQVVQREGPPTLNLRYAYLGDPRDPAALGHGRPPSSDSDEDEGASASSADSDDTQHEQPYAARSAQQRYAARNGD